ncbi:hypothetical protein NHH73_18575 [Oxalobacteraceae bacterium OTU3CINTB1]|nr:hypothetical protein NHH73_18575 [Oxalobacteraceae bacterium OTU3CINTB1]
MMSANMGEHYGARWHALAAALILSTACHGAYATPGRLFNTPAERSVLEASRGKVVKDGVGAQAQAPTRPDAPPPREPNTAPPSGPDGVQPGLAKPGTAAGIDGAAPPAPPAPAQLEMNGVVRSSSGRSTVWLNNTPQSGPQNQFSNRHNKALTVTLPSGRKILLRPGQRYDLADGRVKDVNEP